MTDRKTSLEVALEEAVSRALRDNLAPLQRTADELQHACSDLVAACASSRPSNALPSLLRAQAAASALAAGLSVLSNFVAVALNPREQAASPAGAAAAPAAKWKISIRPSPRRTMKNPSKPPQKSVDAHAQASQVHSHAVTTEDEVAAESQLQHHHPVEVSEPVEEPIEEPAAESVAAEPEPVAEEPFDVASLPAEQQEMHKRANRVAKVAMQDIKLLQPKEVRAGRENKDICKRLRVDIDKARKEYDRRFAAIQDHPVDYFHHWAVQILADGDSEALGEYPYPFSRPASLSRPVLKFCVRFTFAPIAVVVAFAALAIAPPNDASPRAPQAPQATHSTHSTHSKKKTHTATGSAPSPSPTKPGSQLELLARGLKDKNATVSYTKLSAIANQKAAGVTSQRAALALGYYDLDKKRYSQAQQWLQRADARSAASRLRALLQRPGQHRAIAQRRSSCPTEHYRKENPDGIFTEQAVRISLPLPSPLASQGTPSPRSTNTPKQKIAPRCYYSAAKPTLRSSNRSRPPSTTNPST